MSRPVLTLIVPCYNEEPCLRAFWDAIESIKRGALMEIRILFVNDGSTDNSLAVMKEIAEDSSVSYLSFPRNFGKEAAILAGFEHAKSEYVGVMDVDLQDPPSLLPKMIRIILSEDCDRVATRRVSRAGEPRIRSWCARSFYAVISKISSIDLVDGERDYCIMTRRCADAVLACKEHRRFSKGIFHWVGYSTHWLEFENVERTAGETKWSFWGLCRYAILGIIAYSDTPLRFITIAGVVLSFAMFIAIIVLIMREAFFGGSAAGWPSMMCALLLVSGLQLLAIGIVGRYLSEVFFEVKGRPAYIIEEWKE